MTDLPAADEQLLTLHLRDLRRRNLRPPTLRARRETVQRVATIVGKPLMDVNEDDLEQWYTAIEHLAPASRFAYVTHVRMFYRWLTDTGTITADPARNLIKPKVPQGLPHPVTEEQLELALITAPQPMRAWIVLGAYAGLRAGEIARLRRENVLDRHNPPLIHVVDGKGGKERVVPVARVVIDELHQHLQRGRGQLFQTPTGLVLKPEVVSRAVSLHLKQKGILRDDGTPHTCHSLRHRFGTQVYQHSNRDIRMTQDLLGHSSPATTAIYAAWDHDEAAPTVESLASGLSGAAPTILGKRGHRR